ncbi:uncharacterized protein LOC113355932 [Papaver somniferum]|uniref:uncharacterized protein LOC113355932 n=1 Tax=Papaver somniferum TaxID=3469 RepID=UPI000E701775|nr:uncharacterized protein LOC113355932 [Papaver somniferum]
MLEEEDIFAETIEEVAPPPNGFSPEIKLSRREQLPLAEHESDLGLPQSIQPQEEEEEDDEEEEEEKLMEKSAKSMKKKAKRALSARSDQYGATVILISNISLRNFQMLIVLILKRHRKDL